MSRGERQKNFLRSQELSPRDRRIKSMENIRFTSMDAKEKEEYLNRIEQSFFERKETEELANYINHYYCEFKNWTSIKKREDIKSMEQFNVYHGKECPKNCIGVIARYPDGEDYVYSTDTLIFYQEDGMVTDDRFGTRNRNRIIRFSPKYRETYNSNIREKIITDDYIEKVMVNGESVRESFI